MDDKHFDKVFWFVSALVGAVILVDTLSFFFEFSKSGQKYADNNLPVLNTGAMMAGIYYLLGGNPNNKKPDTTAATQSGDITVKP